MAQSCWQIRPCDEEMRSRCAHAQVPELCPIKCVFGQCRRPQHKLMEDFGLCAQGLGDCDDVVKEECLYCEVFLKAAVKRKVDAMGTGQKARGRICFYWPGTSGRARAASPGCGRSGGGTIQSSRAVSAFRCVSGSACESDGERGC